MKIEDINKHLDELIEQHGLMMVAFIICGTFDAWIKNYDNTHKKDDDFVNRMMLRLIRISYKIYEKMITELMEDNKELKDLIIDLTKNNRQKKIIKIGGYFGKFSDFSMFPDALYIFETLSDRILKDYLIDVEVKNILNEESEDGDG